MLCGNQGMPPSSTEIPTIGCFGVQSGGSARGMFDGQPFVVAVDARGEPKCHFDDAAAECGGCIGKQIPECPVRLVVVSHNPDKSVSFSVQRKADGNRYLFRIDAWNRYREQRQTRQEVEAAQTQAAPNALLPGAFAAPPIPQQSAGPPLPPELPPGLPPGLVPAVVEQTDGPGAVASVGWKAQRAYGSGNFAQLDELVETLSQPDQLTDDGMPRIAGVISGLWDFLYNWNNYQVDLAKIAEWRKERPDSYAADITEAILWRAWAWHARGEGYSSSVTPEGWKLFRERLEHAQHVLNQSKARAPKTPLWYQVSLSVGRDMEMDRDSYQALFREAVKKYPGYVPFYLSMTEYLSPKWGGTYEAVDRFALVTTGARGAGKDYAMYARIYWTLSDNEEMDVDLFKNSRASWARMQQGFEQLLTRYPKSSWNLNAYAAFACRANDASTYGVLRSRIGPNVIATAWPSNYSVDVCDQRLLQSI